jgi:hypothetical protein
MWRLIHIGAVKSGELTQELIEEIREDLFKRWLTTEMQFIKVRRLLPVAVTQSPVGQFRPEEAIIPAPV